jgi:hypothetical protein
MNSFTVFRDNAAPFAFRAIYSGRVICKVPVVCSWMDDPGKERFFGLRKAMPR